MNSHQRTHTGEMPFHCKQCDKSFNRLGNLKRARAAFSRDRYFEPAIENTIPDPNPNPNPNLRGYPRIEIPAHRITGILPVSCILLDGCIDLTNVMMEAEGSEQFLESSSLLFWRWSLM